MAAKEMTTLNLDNLEALLVRTWAMGDALAGSLSYWVQFTEQIDNPHLCCLPRVGHTQAKTPQEQAHNGTWERASTSQKPAERRF